MVSSVALHFEESARIVSRIWPSTLPAACANYAWETNLQVQNRETTPVQGVIAIADIPVGFRTLDEEVSKKYFKGTEPELFLVHHSVRSRK
jgi:hypothetical protein